MTLATEIKEEPWEITQAKNIISDTRNELNRLQAMTTEDVLKTHKDLIQAKKTRLERAENFVHKYNVDPVGTIKLFRAQYTKPPTSKISKRQKQCSSCGEVFPTKQQLKDHKELKHSVAQDE